MSRSRKLLAAGWSMALLMLPASNTRAATLLLLNLDGAGEGFNDPTPVAPVTGNPGITRGQQRLNAFQAAANVWGSYLRSGITIRVQAQMNPLAPCGPGGAVLGSAGPVTVFRDFTNAPQPSTWYAAALADSLAVSNLGIPPSDDIGATFSSSIDAGCLPGVSGWWYGVGAPPPGGTIDFFTTVLHEIGHGVGFVTLVDLATGAKLQNFDDTYMRNLEDHNTSPFAWPSLSNGQRVASAIDTGQLHWVGPRALDLIQVLTNGTAAGHIRMFAPSPLQQGSSVSHWDTLLSPNELMEPILTLAPRQVLTNRLLEDLGWKLHWIFDDGFESNSTQFWSATVP